MRIVLRGTPAYHVDQITAGEAEALRSWYGHSSSAEQDAIALAVIRRAKTKDGWIECDCIAGDFKPLLAPQQQERTFTLRRLTPADGDPHARVDRPNHADNCPFHVDRDFEPPAHDRAFNLRPVRHRDTAYIDALPAIPSRLADPNRTPPDRDRERNDRPSKLAIVLWRLMDAAAVNVLKALQDQPSPYRLKDQLAALHNAGVNWRVTRTWRFSALSTTWAGDYRDKSSRFQRLLRKSRNDWAPNQRRTGFMILFAPSVTEKLIRPAAISEPIELHSRVRQPLRGDPRRRGPYLVIANTDFGDEDDGELRAVQSYAQPVFNGDTLFPVESGFERDVTDLLIWLQKSLFEAAPRLRITITKPLFAISTPKGLCRPDFILETAYGYHPPVRLVIEAMGMDTDQYLEAKAKTLPRMEEIGPLYEITPDDMGRRNAQALGADLQHWVLEHAAFRRLRLFNE
ncbi:MAG: hypothetical protein M9924_21965 [Rhizobiaceae bacterium]|nr:hypothetical protein [Rhizobiaceae bacterium]